MAVAIATTGSNRAIGVLTGYRRTKSCPSTMLFCPVMSYGSLVVTSRNMAKAGWLHYVVHGGSRWEVGACPGS
jgi:hypothetical protein